LQQHFAGILSGRRGRRRRKQGEEIEGSGTVEFVGFKRRCGG
jgi:hypothetical protein